MAATEDSYTARVLRETQKQPPAIGDIEGRRRREIDLDKLRASAADIATTGDFGRLSGRIYDSDEDMQSKGMAACGAACGEEGSPKALVSTQIARLASILGNTWDMVRSLEHALYPILRPVEPEADASPSAEDRPRQCEMGEMLMTNCSGLEALYVHLGDLKDRIQL